MLKFLFPAAADTPPERGPAAKPAAAAAARLEPRLVERHLGQLFATDGVVACAVVDAASGLLLAEQSRDGVDMDAAAAACAEALRALRQAAVRLGQPAVDEMTLTFGPTLQLVRILPRQTSMFLLVLVDRPRANLALARFRMAEAQRNLA